MKLAIISHTPHYKKNGTIVGWGATVREINHLTELFDEIYHLAPLHEGEAPGSSLPYENEKTKFVSLKPYGGETLRHKLSVITTSFHNLKKISSVADIVDWLQFRAPTAMGLYVLPYISLRKKPKRWVKYAGNWNMENAPWSYRFQKWWLINNFQRSRVTINGYWKGQKAHLLNFENPCLDNDELERAGMIARKKDFTGKLTLCFAGTLTGNKGAGIILEAVSDPEFKSMIGEIIFAGDGRERKKYEDIASRIDLKITFKGFLSRKELECIYGMSHMILLPSESEGFPKVIAEAAAYGCVPVVSDVSSISQYFNDGNAFLLKRIDSPELNQKLKTASGNRGLLKEMSGKSAQAASLFTFENYIKNLKEKILIE